MTNSKKEFAIYLSSIIPLIIISIILTTLFSNTTSEQPYAINNPNKNGTMALIQVLKNKKIEIEKIKNYSQLTQIKNSQKTATVIVNPNYIPKKSLQKIITKTKNDLFLLNIINYKDNNVESDFKGKVDNIKSECKFEYINNKTKISHSLTSIHTSTSTEKNIIKCFPTTNNNYALIINKTKKQKIFYISDASIFNNKNITSASNASLALNMFSKYQKINWYTSDITDQYSMKKIENNPLTPPWAKNIIIITLISAILLLISKSKRLKPIAKENNITLTRSTDTTTGKANLYKKNNDQNYVAEIIRIYYLEKIKKILHLNNKLEKNEIIRILSNKINTKYEDLEKIFYTQPINSNEELTILSINLESIEQKVKNGK